MTLFESAFDGMTITMRKDWHKRTKSGSWQRKPYKTSTEQITAREYIIAVQRMFRGDRIERGYTFAGYIPVKVTSIEPTTRQYKFTATFTIALNKQ